MKKIASISVVFILLGFAHLSAAELKIGYVNLQRALNECEAGIRAKAELKEEAKKLERQLTEKQEELKKLREEIEKKHAVWNEETRKAKERDYQTKSQQLQQEFVRLSEELNKKRSKKEEKIIKELRSLIDQVAEEKGYTYVLEASTGLVIYGPEEDDITDMVIKLYNEKLKEKK